MIDLLALGLSHGLLALMAWRLLQRADLDRDPPPAETPGEGAAGTSRNAGGRRRG
jgi:hypothetical protein